MSTRTPITTLEVLKKKKKLSRPVLPLLRLYRFPVEVFVSLDDDGHLHRSRETVSRPDAENSCTIQDLLSAVPKGGCGTVVALRPAVIGGWR
ncbi:hypothetical protein Pmani_026886 [Petrolisthes manimaculis]|uniref:Uncharacterized protein n=1 Tax=Petrolisthes manimaculis TaxID=1843537 RepID=A0AAE1P2M6_9EUCA|nr:hypothetical protein Pmani_026886 [Petrolisthes manimaculis]